MVFDQIAKWLVREQLALGESSPVIPGFFHLTRVHNTGAAFGVMNTMDFPFKGAVLALASTGALIGLAVALAFPELGLRLIARLGRQR